MNARSRSVLTGMSGFIAGAIVANCLPLPLWPRVLLGFVTYFAVSLAVHACWTRLAP